jgi:hypothetical protein
MQLDSATVNALLAALGAAEEANVPASEAPTKQGQGTHFASLGFVACGNGEDPGEGAIIQVPTKSGKNPRVRTLQRIDVAPFQGEFGEWAYTYKRLKRGES